MLMCQCPDTCGLETSYKIMHTQACTDYTLKTTSTLINGFPKYIVPLLISECIEMAPRYTLRVHQEVANDIHKLLEPHLGNGMHALGLKSFCQAISEYMFSPCMLGSISYNTEGKRYRLDGDHVIVDNFRWKCPECSPSYPLVIGCGESSNQSSRQVAQTDSNISMITIRHDDWSAKEMLLYTHNPLTMTPLRAAQEMLIFDKDKLYQGNTILPQNTLQVWLHSTGVCDKIKGS